MAIDYTRTFLNVISLAVASKHLCPDLWRRLTRLNIARFKSTCRGCLSSIVLRRTDLTQLSISVGKVWLKYPTWCYQMLCPSSQKWMKLVNLSSVTKIELAFITETWMKDCLSNGIVDISAYSLVQKNWKSDADGDVCVYIKRDKCKYQKLIELACCNDHESLWHYLRPNCLARGFPCNLPPTKGKRYLYLQPSFFISCPGWV